MLGVFLTALGLAWPRLPCTSELGTGAERLPPLPRSAGCGGDIDLQKPVQAAPPPLSVAQFGVSVHVIHWSVAFLRVLLLSDPLSLPRDSPEEILGSKKRGWFLKDSSLSWLPPPSLPHQNGSFGLGSARVSPSGAQFPPPCWLPQGRMQG